jgi:hypothetical protein
MHDENRFLGTFSDHNTRTIMVYSDCDMFE